MNKTDYKDILDFWFKEENKPNWFLKSDEFDEEIHNKFYEVWKQGSVGLLYGWRENLKGRLAEIIVLDQFSRNLCRDKKCAFSQDKMALILAQEAVKQEGFYELDEEERKFMIMPFMHSESLEIQKQSVKLFEELGESGSLEYAYKHKEIIERFNRYPHRNDVLGRETTKEEKEFLKQPGSSF